MAIQQLSVYAENKPRELYNILNELAEASIDIRALNIAETKDFGVLRMIVSDTDKAKEILSENRLVATTDVVAVNMEDVAGELCKIIKVLGNNNMNIEYTYAFTEPNSGAKTVLRVDNPIEAEKILKDAGIEIITK